MADEPGVVKRNRPFAEDLADRLIKMKAERDDARAERDVAIENVRKMLRTVEIMESAMKRAKEMVNSWPTEWGKK